VLVAVAPWRGAIKPPHDAVVMTEYIVDGNIPEALGKIKKYANIKVPKGTVNLETYITNNIEKIDYKYYKECGYFVGSGAIESGNKTVLQRRLKQAGMRWSPETAQPLLTLRAKVESGLWDEVRKLVLNYNG